MKYALEVFLVAVAFFGSMELIGYATRCRCEHCRLDFPRDEMRRALSSAPAPNYGTPQGVGPVPNLSQRIPPLVNDERGFGRPPGSEVAKPEVVHGHASTSGPLRRPIVNGSGIVQ